MLVQLAEKADAKILDRVGPLAEFLKENELKLALEVRHSSWLKKETYDELKRHNVALVVSDRFTITKFEDTANFAYIRRHGPPSSGKYWGNYTEEDLKKDAALIRQISRGGKNVYIFFNNDGRAHAPRNAQTLMRLLGVHPPGKHVSESLIAQVNQLSENWSPK